MQHFITLPPKQIQLQKYWETGRFSREFGRQSKKKIKISIRQPSIVQAFLFQRPAPSSFLYFTPHPFSHSIACANSESVAPYASAILLPHSRDLILPWIMRKPLCWGWWFCLYHATSNKQQAPLSIHVICSGTGSLNNKYILLSSSAPHFVFFFT